MLNENNSMINENISERAYRELRQAVINGTLPADRKVTEAGLAELLGISRTPVREAVKRLVLEGLLERRKGKGLWCAYPDATEMREIFDLRYRLEAYAAGLAAKRITPEQLSELWKSVRRMEKLVELSSGGADRDIIAEIDAENSHFHNLILSAAHSPRLASLLKTTVDLSLVIRTFRNYSPEQRQGSAFMHREIVRALQARDSLWAERLMEAHILAAAASFKDTEGPTEPGKS